MTEIENLLADDFARLVRRFNSDEFTSSLLARLKGADRLRVIGVGAAGGVGAAFAASQFAAVTELFARTAPAAAMAAPLGSVKTYVARAREKLKKALSAETAPPSSGSPSSTSAASTPHRESA